jgi:hypothetical protein
MIEWFNYLEGRGSDGARSLLKFRPLVYFFHIIKNLICLLLSEIKVCWHGIYFFSLCATATSIRAAHLIPRIRTLSAEYESTARHNRVFRLRILFPCSVRTLSVVTTMCSNRLNTWHATLLCSFWEIILLYLTKTFQPSLHSLKYLSICIWTLINY